MQKLFSRIMFYAIAFTSLSFLQKQNCRRRYKFKFEGLAALFLFLLHAIFSETPEIRKNRTKWISDKLKSSKML